MKSKRAIRDEKWMKRALALAEKGRGRVSPNPCVGAVVVKRGRAVGEGFHPHFGGPHAEVLALRRAGKRARGATLYVTLEPCSTFGKTPPCVGAIAAAGIRRVVAATADPNPKHRGRGFSMLRRRGLSVSTGVCGEQARDSIREFARWIIEKIPFVTVKEAMTLDGKIATRTGDSRWVSSPQARRWIHRLRRRADAILVGKKTAQRDNPRLTVRGFGAGVFQPRRLVLSGDGRISRSLKMFTDRHCDKTRVLGGGKSVAALLRALGKEGITSLLIEGGGETVGRFVEAGAVDKLYLFVAPKIAGGRDAATPVEGAGISKMASALPLRRWSWRPVGKDLLIEGDL